MRLIHLGADVDDDNLADEVVVAKSTAREKAHTSSVDEARGGMEGGAASLALAGEGTATAPPSTSACSSLQFHSDIVDELLERDGLTVMAEGMGLSECLAGLLLVLQVLLAEGAGALGLDELLDGLA